MKAQRRNDPMLVKRMVTLGDGRTGKMYEFLSPIVGFDYKTLEYRTFTRLSQKSNQKLMQVIRV